MTALNDALLFKLPALVLAGAAGASAGLAETILDDPLAPCLLGALAGEIARGAFASEPSAERIARRLLVSLAAVIFGTVFAYYAHRVPMNFVPGLTVGFSKMACGLAGWSAIKAIARLEFTSPMASLKAAVFELLEALIKDRKPK